MVANIFYLTTESDSFDAFSSYGNVESIVRCLTPARNSHTMLDEIEANLKNEIELLRELVRELENNVEMDNGDDMSAGFVAPYDGADASGVKSVISVWRNVNAHVPLSKSALSKDKCAKFNRGKCVRRAILAGKVDN
ncbi:MAG: hypothetical protein K2J16_04860, partial [Clostridia bacterium]|nr:hypothetical protein [Clostridia bacterium]